MCWTCCLCQAATLLQKHTISFIHLRAISFRALTAQAHSVSLTFLFFNVVTNIFRAVAIRGGPVSSADGVVQYATLPQTLRAMSNHLASTASGESSIPCPS